MNKDDIDALQKIEQEATTRPWKWIHGDTSTPYPFKEIDARDRDDLSPWLRSGDRHVLEYGNCGSHECVSKPVDRRLIAEFRNRAPEILSDLQQLSDARQLRRRDEWHEGHGSVLWWRLPIVEAPYVGSPLDCDWDDDYYTHWTKLVIPTTK